MLINLAVKDLTQEKVTVREKKYVVLDFKSKKRERFESSDSLLIVSDLHCGLEHAYGGAMIWWCVVQPEDCAVFESLLCTLTQRSGQETRQKITSQLEQRVCHTHNLLLNQTQAWQEEKNWNDMQHQWCQIQLLLSNTYTHLKTFLSNSLHLSWDECKMQVNSLKAKDQCVCLRIWPLNGLVSFKDPIACVLFMAQQSHNSQRSVLPLLGHSWHSFLGHIA